MDNIIEFLKISGFAGVIGYVINILFKNMIESKYSRELEKVKSELAVLKENQSYRFNKLHDKRFSVFEELFKLLNQYYYDLHLFAFPGIMSSEENPYMEQRKNRFEQCNKSKNNFILYYMNNVIYFNQELINNIETFKTSADKIFEVNYQYLFMEVNADEFGNTKKDLFEYSKPALQSFGTLESEVKNLLKEIEKTLRDQLSYEKLEKN